MKKRILVMIFTALLLSLLCGCSMKQSGLYQISGDDKNIESDYEQSDGAQNKDALYEDDASAQKQNVNESDGVIYIHICGAVKNPGVYEMNETDRIFDAVEAAGGFTDEACEDYINLASLLSDGLKIVIPTEDEAKELQITQIAGLDTPAQTDSRVNINTAGVDELCSISGIGETKAEAIVAYRDSVGRFSNPEEIMNVAGIGEGTYSRIKEKITVGK